MKRIRLTRGSPRAQEEEEDNGPELDPEEDSSIRALVSLKEGSLSNTWNDHYTSPQKTPTGNGGTSGSTMEMPFRTSKRSRLFCEEEERQMNTRSPKRNLKSVVMPQKLTPAMPTPDKKASQKIGLRLRNLLKLPKAHKWCIYEWFYSNIDKPLFEGDNDFCVCLKESFPNLKTRKLSRVEWGKIRRLMGKPRRCSSAFFEEERSALQQKRQKIRLLQQRKVADISQFKDLPEEIPLPLVIGTKVTARLRGLHDGLFTGQIDAVDTLNSTYRVTFDRSGLGTHTVPDYEVLSNEPHETMPISAFGQKQRPARFFMTPPRLNYTPTAESPIADSDPLLGQSPWKLPTTTSDSETIGGFPVEFLIQVTRLSKILMIKKEHIKQLKEMNTEAEKLKSYSIPISIEYQRRYATIVLDLEQLNKDLNKVLHKVQQYCYELAPDQGLQPADQPTDMRRRCEEEAQEMVRQANSTITGQACVENESLTDLISRLTAILLQIKCLAEGGDLNSFEFKSLTDSINDIKSTIDTSNISDSAGLPEKRRTSTLKKIYYEKVLRDAHRWAGLFSAYDFNGDSPKRELGLQFIGNQNGLEPPYSSGIVAGGPGEAALVHHSPVGFANTLKQRRAPSDGNGNCLCAVEVGKTDQKETVDTTDYPVENNCQQVYQ